MKKIIIISLAMLFVLTVCRASTLNKINSQFTEELRQETVEKSEKEQALDKLIKRKEEEHRRIHAKIRQRSEEIQREFDAIRADRQNSVGTN